MTRESGRVERTPRLWRGESPSDHTNHEYRGECATLWRQSAQNGGRGATMRPLREITDTVDRVGLPSGHHAVIEPLIRRF